jgi:cyclophilin family peptidyl-prolyl cis-trans isomerase
MTRVLAATAAVLALSLTLLLVAAGCGGDDDAGGTPTTTEAAGGCDEAEAPAPRDPGSLDPPEEELDATVDHQLEVETNCGDFTVTLTPDLAPEATASLVSLAKSGYFDDTVFHRIVPGFVIQGGDPTQTGAGGPGYTTIDPPPADARYVHGVVAMAKTADEPPGAAGSQFFIVTGEDVGLPPDYAIVGTVEGEGLDVVDRIGALGDESETPTQAVVIEQVSVESS